MNAVNGENTSDRSFGLKTPLLGTVAANNREPVL